MSSLEQNLETLQQQYSLSDGSIALLKDKGFKEEDFDFLREILDLPDNSFKERRDAKSRIERILDAGDSPEITTGRYARYTRDFCDISSEQAKVKGRMKFAVEYMINLAELVSSVPEYQSFIPRQFTDEEQRNLRSIYEGFRTKDYVAAKIIEDRTNHDVVAANAWVMIRGQQLGIDGDLMRKVTHFCRTSADADTNTEGELYMRAFSKWTSSLAKLLGLLKEKAEQNINVTCVAETHGQDAQLTTLGHIYANLTEQIAMHAGYFLDAPYGKSKIDGKIGGAIGTDVDMVAALPSVDPSSMYRHIVEDIFGLKNVRLGNDQDCSNASLVKLNDAMNNVGMVVKKAATDVWIYASRAMLAKMTVKGESGSSAMPQKTNPFFAEGCEALMSFVAGASNPFKENIVAYREQGDLRRSITKREGFHAIMLSVIGIERLIGEIKKYTPNIAAIEAEIYHSGPQIASSAINNYLRAAGVPDAYDRVKDVVMKPYVVSEEVSRMVDGMVDSHQITDDAGARVKTMLACVMDVDGNMAKLQQCYTEDNKQMINEVSASLAARNSDTELRKPLLGNAVADTKEMILNCANTINVLRTYEAQYK